MGFFDRIGDIGKGFADVGLGIGKFGVDTVMSGKDILTGDVDEGFERLLASVQEDLLGQTLQGAFGPEGIIGSVVGALPEGIRKPGRAVVGPAFEAWNWATEELVDRPLGTIATLINLSLTGRPDLLFDGSAWARAWDINDKRTLGQSVTAAIHFIDPFDDEAYNKLAQDPFFNVMSGFIDFSQEIFLDPIERGLRGVKNLSTGKTVVAVAKEGRLIEKGMDLNDVYMVGRKKVSKNGRLGYKMQPERVYTPGGGLPFRKENLRVGENGEQLIGLRTALGRSINYARVDSVMETAWWDRASKAMDQPNLSFAERLDALETATGKRFLGAKQATEAFTLIANGPTAKARELTARVLLGDDRVFDEAIALADELQAELIPDENGVSWVDKLKEAINKKEKLAEIGIEITERAKQGDDAARLAEVRREQQLAETEVEFGLGRELVDEEGNVPELRGGFEVREETGIELIGGQIGDPSTARDIYFGPPDKPGGGYFEFDTPREVVNGNQMMASNRANNYTPMIEFTRGSETNPGHAYIRIRGQGKVPIIGMNVLNNYVVVQNSGGYLAYEIVVNPNTGKLEWQTSSQISAAVLGGNLETAINSFTRDLPDGWIWGSEPTAANIAEYKKAVTEKQRKAEMVSDEVNASSLAEEALELDFLEQPNESLRNLIDVAGEPFAEIQDVAKRIEMLNESLDVVLGELETSRMLNGFPDGYAPAEFTTVQRATLNQQIKLEILRKLDLESIDLTVNDFFSDEVINKLDEQMFGKVEVDVPPLEDVFPVKYVSRQQIHQALVNDAAKKGRLYPMLKTDVSSSIAQIQELLLILMLSLPEYMAGRLLPQRNRKPRYQSYTGFTESAPYIEATRRKLREYGLMPDVQYEGLLDALIIKHREFFEYRVAVFESVTGSSLDTIWNNFIEELTDIPNFDRVDRELMSSSPADYLGATVEETLGIIEESLKEVDKLAELGDKYGYAGNTTPVAELYENVQIAFFALNEFFAKHLPEQYKKFPEKLAEITDADLKKVVQEEMKTVAKLDQLTFLDKDFYSTARLIIDNPENLSPSQIALQIVKRFTTFKASDLSPKPKKKKGPLVKFADILGGPEPGVVYTAKKSKDGGHGVFAKGARTPLIKLRKSGGKPELRIEISFRNPRVTMQQQYFPPSHGNARPKGLPGDDPRFAAFDNLDSTGNIVLERVKVKGSPKEKYRIAGFTSYLRKRKIDFKPEELQLIGFQLDDYAKLYDSPNAVYEDIVEQNFGIARATSSAKKKKTDFEGVGAKRQAPGINDNASQLALIRHHVQKLVDKINKEGIEVPAQLEIVTEQLDEFDAAVAGVEPTQELVNFNALADLSDEGLDAEVVKLTQEVEQLSAELTPTLEKVNAVDWESLFDIEMAKRSNMQRNKGLFGGEVPNTPTLEELFMDDPGSVALLSTVFDIIVARNELGGNLNDLDMFAGKRLGFLDTYYGAPFFARAGTVAAKLEKAESDAKPNPMPIVEAFAKADETMSGLDVMEALGQVELTEYYNRSITSPFGIRAFRIFNQRLPHSMISWNHTSSIYTQIQRTVEQVGKVKLRVPVSRFSKEELLELAGDNTSQTRRIQTVGNDGMVEVRLISYQEQIEFIADIRKILAESSQNVRVEKLKNLYEEANAKWARRGDDLIKKAGVKLDMSLEEAYMTSGALKDNLIGKKQATGAGKRKPRQAVSVGTGTQIPATTATAAEVKKGLETGIYSRSHLDILDANGNPVRIISGLSPAMMKQSSVIPRWDLVGRSVRKIMYERGMTTRRSQFGRKGKLSEYDIQREILLSKKADIEATVNKELEKQSQIIDNNLSKKEINASKAKINKLLKELELEEKAFNEKYENYQFRLETTKGELSEYEVQREILLSKKNNIEATVNKELEKIDNNLSKEEVDALIEKINEPLEELKLEEKAFNEKYEKEMARHRIKNNLGSARGQIADATMQIWRPLVLLTPKWALRIQIDETLRRAADVGALTELTNLIVGTRRMKEAHAVQGLDFNYQTVFTDMNARAKNLAENEDLLVLFKEKHGREYDPNSFGDQLRLVEDNMDLINESTGSNYKTPYEMHTKEVVKQARENGNKAKLYLPSALRFLVVAPLLNPVYGAAWSGYHMFKRWRRINDVAQMNIGLQIADQLQQEARKLLTDAIVDEDVFLQEIAESMLSRADGMKEEVERVINLATARKNADGESSLVKGKDGKPVTVNTDLIVDNMQKADTLMQQAGFGNLDVEGAVVRNAYGDDSKHREMISSEVSSTGSVMSMLRSRREFWEREFKKGTADIETLVLFKEGLQPSDGAYVRGWNSLMNRYVAIGTRFNTDFHRIVWENVPARLRIEKLAESLRNNPELRERLGVADGDLFDEIEYQDYTMAATAIVAEFDNVLPFIEGAEGLQKLRDKVRSREEVTWDEVQKYLESDAAKSELLLGDKIPTEPLARKFVDYPEDPGELAAFLNEIGAKSLEEIDNNPKKFLTEEQYNNYRRGIRQYKAELKDLELEGLVGNIRSRGFVDFAVANSPNQRTIATSRIQGVSQAVGDHIEGMFKTLGTIPADELSRNPYFRTKYQREVARLVSYHVQADGTIKLSQGTLRGIEQQARERALLETKDLLYDLAEETKFAEMTRNIFPFFNAWQEVLGRWGRLSIENPAFVGKAWRLYSSPWNAETFGITEIEDENGNKYLTFQLPSYVENIPKVLRPGVLGDLTETQTIRFSKEGLMSMVQSGMPGFGPLLTIPIREAILDDPSLEDSLSFMFPLGHPEGPFTQRMITGFLPAYQQNIQNLLMDTPTKERVVQSMALQIYTEREEAGIPIDLSNELEVNQWIREANDRARDFFTFRIATGLFSPTSTTAVSPYSDLMKIARDYRLEFGIQEGDAKFLAEYGEELFALTARMTRLNDGVASSATSEKAREEVVELVQAFPEIGAFLTFSLGGSDEAYKFSQAVYRKQQQENVSESDPRKRRERKTPLETLQDVEVELGWKKFDAVMNKVRIEQDKRLQVGAPTSLNHSSLIWLRDWKNDQIAKIKAEHPAWGSAFEGASIQKNIVRYIDGFIEAMRNEHIQARPSFVHLVRYFTLRGKVEGELIRRANEEDGSLLLSANSNNDLLLYWETEKEMLGNMPEFSRIYDRYFARDMVPPESFVSVLERDELMVA